MFARGALDIFDDLLAGAFRCLSHRPLLSDFDEPETLSWQTTLFGPIGADGRQRIASGCASNPMRALIRLTSPSI